MYDCVFVRNVSYCIVSYRKRTTPSSTPYAVFDSHQCPFYPTLSYPIVSIQPPLSPAANTTTTT